MSVYKYNLSHDDALHYFSDDPIVYGDIDNDKECMAQVMLNTHDHIAAWRIGLPNDIDKAEWAPDDYDGASFMLSVMGYTK